MGEWVCDDAMRMCMHRAERARVRVENEANQRRTGDVQHSAGRFNGGRRDLEG